MSVFKLLYDHFYQFIKGHPVITFGIFVVMLWLPMLTSFFDGDFLKPIVNIYIMQFPYVNIPLGFSLLFIGWVPLYYLYIKPHDAALEKKRMDEWGKALGAKKDKPEPHGWMRN